MKYLTRLGSFIASLPKVASQCIAVLSSDKRHADRRPGRFNWRVSANRKLAINGLPGSHGQDSGRFVGDTEVGGITSGLRQSGATVGFKIRRDKHLGDE
jgi:hypothetical protein